MISHRRLRTSPRSITTSRLYVQPSIRRVPNEDMLKCVRASSCRCVQALFFEMTAENGTSAVLRGDYRSG
jgi:hypothetical protein